jgi:GTP pyrophosphokinase
MADTCKKLQPNTATDRVVVLRHINYLAMEYTPQDELLIEEKWHELEELCREHKVCRREDDWQFVKRAYFLAKEAHKGVRRRSGEPYIIHPIEVAMICVREIGLGKKSVVAA